MKSNTKIRELLTEMGISSASNRGSFIRYYAECNLDKLTGKELKQFLEGMHANLPPNSDEMFNSKVGTQDMAVKIEAIAEKVMRNIARSRIDFPNSEYSINAKVKLERKQIAKMELMSAAQQQQYLLSLAGLHRARIAIPKPKPTGNERKPSNSILKKFEHLLANSEDMMHKPTVRNEKSKYIGVEIECFIPSDFKYPAEPVAACNTCKNVGNTKCVHCTGNGYVTVTDKQGRVYESVRCPDCIGNGVVTCIQCGGSSRQNSNINAHTALRRMFRDNKVTRCSVKYDGSLNSHGNYTGVEVTLLLDTQHGLGPIVKVCQLLNSIGAKVNSDCGLHVHLDAYNLTEREVTKKGEIFRKFLPILAKLVPQSRRENEYCRLQVSGFGGQRHSAVNLTAYHRHRTIEIRLHSGSTSSSKISNWIELLLAIYALDEIPKTRIQSISGLTRALKLSDNLLVYLTERFEKFNSTNAEESENSGQDTVDVSSEFEMPGPDATDLEIQNAYNEITRLIEGNRNRAARARLEEMRNQIVRRLQSEGENDYLEGSRELVNRYLNYSIRAYIPQSIDISQTVTIPDDSPDESDSEEGAA